MHRSKVQDLICSYMLFIDGYSMSSSTIQIAIEIPWIPLDSRCRLPSGGHIKEHVTAETTVAQLKGRITSEAPNDADCFLRLAQKIWCWTSWNIWNGLWWYMMILCFEVNYRIELSSWTMIRICLRAQQWLNYAWTDGTMIRHLDYVLFWSASFCSPL